MAEIKERISVLLTLKYHWCSTIRSGKKEYEVRKTCPHLELPFNVLCAESQSKGRISCEFTCDEIIKVDGSFPKSELEKLIKKACLTKEQFINYSNGMTTYFWHISNPIDYCSEKGRSVMYISEFGFKKVPQSWRYIVTTKGHP